MTQQTQTTEKAISDMDSILLKITTLAHAGKALAFCANGNEDDLGDIGALFTLISDLAKEGGSIAGNVI